MTHPDSSKPRGRELQLLGLQLGTRENGKMELQQGP